MAANFDQPMNTPSSQQQQQQQSFLQLSDHPVVLIFHLLFKALAILAYLLLTKFFDMNFILVFVITVLLLAFDFWTVKNVSGRLLVGLRWWNEVREDGSNVWIFESRPEKTANATDSRIFWYSLYITPAVWLLFGLFCLINLQVSWLLVVAVATSLSIANVIGYTRCERDAARRRASENNNSSGLSSTLGTLLTNSLIDRARNLL